MSDSTQDTQISTENIEKKRLIENEETSFPKRVNSPNQTFRMTDQNVEKEISSHSNFKILNHGGYCLYPASMLSMNQYNEICDLIKDKIGNYNAFYSPALQRKVIEGRCNMLKQSPETSEFEICYRQACNPNEFLCGYHRNKKSDRHENNLIWSEFKKIDDKISRWQSETEQRVNNLFKICNFLFEENQKIRDLLNSQRQDTIYIDLNS